MRTEPAFTTAVIPMPPSVRAETGAPVESAAEQAVGSQRNPASPLLAYIAASVNGGSRTPAEEDALLQLAERQEALLLERKRDSVIDALRHSPWFARADADPDDAQSQWIVQEARLQLKALLPADLLAPIEQRTTGSHREFFDEISKVIGHLDDELKSQYSDLLAGYVRFYRELTGILADLKDQLGKPDSDGMIEVNFKGLLLKLEKLKETWVSKGFGAVFESKADAEKLLAELGIEGLKVVQLPDGSWQVGIDTGLIDSLRNVFQPAEGSISATALNELLQQKETMMESFNFINRALPEKYQRRLQMWDALVKLLSSTIDAITDADSKVIAAMAG